MKCFTMIPILSYGACVSDTCNTNDAQMLAEIGALCTLGNSFHKHITARQVMIDRGVPVCQAQTFCDDYHEEKDMRYDGWTIFIL